MSLLQRLCRARGWRCERQLGRSTWLIRADDGRRCTLKLAQCDKTRYFLENQWHWQRRNPDSSGASAIEFFAFEGATLLRNHFIEGPTLAQLLRAHWQDQSEETQLLVHMQQLAQVLAQVHASGCVHADLKPSNVLCATPLVLLDFAGARALGEAADGVPYQSYSHHYSLPQQRTGKGLVSPCWDWYGYFCILHIAMFGEPVQAIEHFGSCRQFEVCLEKFSARCDGKLAEQLAAHHAQLIALFERRPKA